MENEVTVPRKSPWWQPSFLDVVLAALLAWLFVLSPKGWNVLLADGDTGWHIRTGDWILANRRIPDRDLFSFTKAGEPWFAWEWLADVLFSLLHSWGGLSLLAFFCALVLLGSAVLLLRYCVWRGAAPIFAFPVFLLAIGGSTVHYLARPHIFSLLFLVVTLWILDLQRRESTWHLWLLVPLTALWTNLHAAWPALFVSLALQIGFRLLRRDPAWRREVSAAAACAAATLVNPFGWGLHSHILAHVGSDWIKNTVDEFQSPQFRSESVLQYEILLLLGLGSAWRRFGRDWAGKVEALLLLFWAHFSLASVRHIPIYVIVASPVLACELTQLATNSWATARRSSFAGIFRDLNRDLQPRFRSLTPWALLLSSFVWVSSRSSWPGDFPPGIFPVRAIQASGAALRGNRVFMSDQWADYWIYQAWPDAKVYIDGRIDLFGPVLGEEALSIAQASPGWDAKLAHRRIRHAVLPPNSPLAGAMRSTGWQVLHQDEVAVVLAAPAESAKPDPAPPGKYPDEANGSSPTFRIHRGEDPMPLAKHSSGGRHER
jgi:hypothetical protein